MDFFSKITSKKRNIFFYILIVTIISTITLFLINGMTRGHDFPFHLARVQGIYDNLVLGKLSSIYPYYLGGYGYANNLFYPDLFLYFPAILRYIGLSIISSYKIFIFVITFSSILTMYISVNGITKNKKAALISSTIYAFSSYRLIDTFTRAALGEALAFIFAPLIIYGIYEIIYNDYKKWYYLVIGMSGIILSHLLSTYMIVILLVIISLINIKKLFKEKKRILYIILAAIVTILLTSFFIAPMFEQMLNCKFAVNNIANSTDIFERTMPIWAIILEYPFFYMNSPWIPMGIGLVLLLFTIEFFKNFKSTSAFTKTCFILGTIFTLITTNLFPWEALKDILAVFQFPWRFFFIATILLIIGIGSLINEVTFTKKKITVYFILSIIPVISIIFCNFNTVSYTNIRNYEISFGEYLPEGANMFEVKARGETIKSTGEISYKYKIAPLSIDLNFKNNNIDNKLELPFLYYKGYLAKINGKSVPVTKSDKGLVQVEIDNTIHEGNLEVHYENTDIKKIFSVVSLVSLIGFTTYIIILKRGEKNEEKI